MPGIEKLTETLLALAPVAVGYFAGWAYLSAYLAAFQIDISEVSLPLATVLIYSYLTVGTGLFLATTLVLVCLTFIPKGRWNFVRLPLMAVGIWGYAWASVEIARSQAEARSYEVWQGAAPEKMAMVETTKGDTIAEEYNRCGRQRRLLSVFNTMELSYVLCRAGDRKPEAGMIYAVAPDGKIRSRRGAANEVLGPIDSPHIRLWHYVADWLRIRPGAGGDGSATG